MRKFKYLATALSAAAMLAAASTVSAASVSSLLYPVTQLEDDSAEFLQIDANNNGLLDVGDAIRGIINFPQIRNADFPGLTTPLGGVSGNQELSALFSATIISKTANGTITIGTTIYNLFNYVFGPTPGFYAGNANAMALLYVDNNPEFAIGGATCTSTAPGGDCEGNVTDGSLWAVLGNGDPDDLQFANGLAEDLSLFNLLTITQAVGSAQLNFSILENYTGRLFNEVSCVPFCGGAAGADGFTDVVGSGSFLGKRSAGAGTAATPYQFTNDTDFLVSVVPEPGSLALAGLALLGLGIAGYRRKLATQGTPA